MPIPGTTKVPRVEENVGAACLHLSEDDVAALDALPPTTGERN